MRWALPSSSTQTSSPAVCPVSHQSLSRSKRAVLCSRGFTASLIRNRVLRLKRHWRSSHLPRSSRAQRVGYDTELVYLALPSVEVAIERVATRVRNGGHNIPKVVIERRFYRSLHNLFALYIPLVDRWNVFDNCSSSSRLVARGTRHTIRIHAEIEWDTLTQLAKKGLAPPTATELRALAALHGIRNNRG